MNIKERIKNAVNFKSVDRIPTAYRGIPYLSKSLMKYFGYKDNGNLMHEYKGFLKKLGADIWSTGHSPGYFSYYIPECNYHLLDNNYVEDRGYLFALGIKSKYKNIKEYDFNTLDFCEPPLARVEYASELKEGFLSSKLDYFNFKKFINLRMIDLEQGLIEKDDKSEFKQDDYKVEKFINSKEDFICIGQLDCIFMICCFLRGMEQFLMDLITNTKLAEKVINEVGTFSIEFCRRSINNFGATAEWYGMWDDVADQRGMIINPKLFKKYFLPIYKELIKIAKKSNLIFSWHCCGNVNDILNSMIDAGIDVFDVVQTSAKDMELEKFYKDYGKKICIHGGIDVQKLLVSGKKKDIEQEVNKVIDLWGSNGGVILAPSHESLPETPIENIITLYNAINKG